MSAPSASPVTAPSPAPSTPRRRMVFKCPYCHSTLLKRSSFMLHPYLRSDTYTCTNPVCNASFTGHNELTHIASPTGLPDVESCGLPALPQELREKVQADWNTRKPPRK